MIDKKLLADTLRDLATLVETSNEQEYALLLEIGIGELGRGSRSVKQRSKAPKRIGASGRAIDEVIESLKGIRNRESGFEILERSRLTRMDLQELAKRLDLHVMREDNSHRLMEKIVESSIGSRLNSLAIRGELRA